MIVSVSRRTDIPALYHEWFFQRLQAQEVRVKNPFNPAQVRHVSLKKEDVTGFVFWTRDASFLLSRLDELAGYEYVFLITLNAYEKDLEPAFSDRKKAIETIKRLSARIGSDRIIWRYDPILFTDRYDAAFHLEAFARLAEELAGHVRKVVTSFVTTYRKNKSTFRRLGVKEPKTDAMIRLGRELTRIAKEQGLELTFCGAGFDEEETGLKKACCIDDAYFGKKGTFPKDKNQRETCNCVASVDIGMYDTCTHGCAYCYAVGKVETAQKRRRFHDKHKPTLL